MLGTITLTIRGLGLAARIVLGSSLRRMFRPARRPRRMRLGDPFNA